MDKKMYKSTVGLDNKLNIVDTIETDFIDNIELVDNQLWGAAGYRPLEMAELFD